MLQLFRKGIFLWALSSCFVAAASGQGEKESYKPVPTYLEIEARRLQNDEPIGWLEGICITTGVVLCIAGLCTCFWWLDKHNRYYLYDWEGRRHILFFPPSVRPPVIIKSHSTQEIEQMKRQIQLQEQQRKEAFLASCAKNRPRGRIVQAHNKTLQ